MAIQKNNTTSTIYGDFSNMYIRLHVVMQKNGTAIIEYHGYLNKASYTSGNEPLPICSALYTGIITDWSISNIHDVAKANLVSEGLATDSDLVIVDLV
jgi:hypothetical protein